MASLVSFPGGAAYLMRIPKVIKPEQLHDKDSANPSHMIVAVTLSLLVLISTNCILKGLLIFVQLRDIKLIGNFL